MKKFIAFLLSLLLAFSCLLFSACNTNKGSLKQRDTAKKIANGETLKIGIIQLMSHPSLDNCYAGIEQALKDSGIKYDLDHKTGSANSAVSDCTTYAKDMVASNYDMIITIATPAAKSAFAACADTDIPMIFCAVSDPIEAKIVKSLEKPGDLATGTSDVLDFDAHLALIKAFQPNVKKLGVIYTSSEENSLSQLRRLTAVCDKNGIEIVSAAVQNPSEVAAAANNVCAKVDCLLNFTDNNVVNNLSVVLSAANSRGIPVYGSEVEQVINGCMASVSIDYVALGKTTGEMAVKVLRGSDITKMAVQTISDAKPVYNSEVLNALGLTLPSQYANIEDVGKKN